MAATTTTSSSPAAEETAAREWAWLPCNVLDSVLSHLISLQDYLRFTSVCQPWNSTAQAQIRRRIATSQNQPPLLLVPTQNRSCRRRILYSVTANKLLINHTLQIPYHRRCCGSSHGWLAFLGKDYFVTLYNPFTKARIFLPQILPSPDCIKTSADRAKYDRRQEIDPIGRPFHIPRRRFHRRRCSRRVWNSGRDGSRGERMEAR
ncbi:unnamed protein product [Linum trigynum]|uniref:KIB1-4 beta-propeller domain-containing protein n=1 Tax=Linum trigynum TaxID=586398 RepID=A0AAV2G5K3_9ROSI